jgi:hypothetical protein
MGGATGLLLIKQFQTLLMLPCSIQDRLAVSSAPGSQNQSKPVPIPSATLPVLTNSIGLSTTS